MTTIALALIMVSGSFHVIDKILNFIVKIHSGGFAYDECKNDNHCLATIVVSGYFDVIDEILNFIVKIHRRRFA